MTTLPIDLAGKTILITGAARGIGAAIARSCVAAGAQVILQYGQSKSAAESLAEELGPLCLGLLQADFSLTDAPSALFTAACEIAPQINGLVNNAAGFVSAPLELEDNDWLAHWDHTLRVNLSAPALLSKVTIQHMQANGSGTILNIASRAGHRGDDLDMAAYAASKGGLLALTKTLARGLGASRIRVMAIAPGWVETDMAPSEPEHLEHALAEIPWQEIAQPDEVGRLAAFLLSDAAPSATGATFDVNGASYVR